MIMCCINLVWPWQLNHHDIQNKNLTLNRGEEIIFGIYMQFALKWDQIMLCLDNFYIFWKIFDDATDVTSSTCHKKICLTVGKGKFGFFGPPIPLLKQREIKTHM